MASLQIISGQVNLNSGKVNIKSCGATQNTGIIYFSLCCAATAATVQRCAEVFTLAFEFV